MKTHVEATGFLLLRIHFVLGAVASSLLPRRFIQNLVYKLCQVVEISYYSRESLIYYIFEEEWVQSRVVLDYIAFDQGRECAFRLCSDEDVRFFLKYASMHRNPLIVCVFGGGNRLLAMTALYKS